MSSRNQRRKQIAEEANLLTNSPNQLDPKTADAIGFGGLGELALDIAAADLEYQAIEAIKIHDIVPNTIQPRYAIPHTITDIFAIHPNNMGEIFSRWIEEIKLVNKQSFDLQSYLVGKDTSRGDEVEKPEDELQIIPSQSSSTIEKSFMKIVDLASSIRRDGLSNPVSVVRRDGYYELETGERRWLAYHLLYWQFGDSDIISEGQKRNWSKIPSRTVREVDVWRQASENNARDNLNAISKARQLAVLIMDLHGWENFTPYHQFENEHDFYAQVGDGNDWRIPRGEGEKLLNAMGLSNASQLRQYRALLRLPVDEWRRGDDENLTEGELRKVLTQLDTVTPVTVSTTKAQPDPINKLATDATHWRNKLRKEMTTTDTKTRKELKSLVKDEIKQLQQLMDELDNLD